jgi:hypothetical protein
MREVGMITIVQSNNELATQGLLASAGIELKVDVRPELLVAGNALLQDVAQYVQRSSCKLTPGERIDWASSLLILREANREALTFDELAFDGTTILRGVGHALEIWSSQMELCCTRGVSYTSTHYGSKMAISPGLLDWTGPVEGIRYAAEGTMSGWWLFLPGYDGTNDDFKSMRPTHVFHVLSRRLDIARYLALPEGYAFETGSGAVWLERDAHQEGE